MTCCMTLLFLFQQKEIVGCWDLRCNELFLHAFHGLSRQCQLINSFKRTRLLGGAALPFLLEGRLEVPELSLQHLHSSLQSACGTRAASRVSSDNCRGALRALFAQLGLPASLERLLRLLQVSLQLSLALGQSMTVSLLRSVCGALVLPLRGLQLLRQLQCVHPLGSLHFLQEGLVHLILRRVKAFLQDLPAIRKILMLSLHFFRHLFVSQLQVSILDLQGLVLVLLHNSQGLVLVLQP
mmetsp:Transcript_70354/g.132789  ORF Transcript_70354/g.132789 Transcript_70354/m.132789 type:complete len:239 (-) Transcript_70354:2160-2876(-)